MVCAVEDIGGPGVGAAQKVVARAVALWRRNERRGRYCWGKRRGSRQIGKRRYGGSSLIGEATSVI